MFYGLKTETNRAKTGIPAALEIRWESVLMMMMMMMILRVVTLQSDCLFFSFFCISLPLPGSGSCDVVCENCCLLNT